MSYDDCIKAMEIGIEIVDQMAEEGYDIIGTGELGMANTSSSSCVLVHLSDVTMDEAVGKGAGLTDEAHQHKKDVLNKALALNKPNANDPIDVIAKVGGFDIAGLVGVYLACAAHRIPVVVDGFISAAAALAAVKLCPSGFGLYDYFSLLGRTGIPCHDESFAKKNPCSCWICVWEREVVVPWPSILWIPPWPWSMKWQPLAKLPSTTKISWISGSKPWEKLFLITGGARSGKSTFAETLALEKQGKILYVATAKAIDEEMKDRIRRHQNAVPIIGILWSNTRGCNKSYRNVPKKVLRYFVGLCYHYVHQHHFLMIPPCFGKKFLLKICSVSRRH